MVNRRESRLGGCERRILSGMLFSKRGMKVALSALKPSSFSNSHFVISDNCDGDSNEPVSLLSVKNYKNECRCAKDEESRGQVSTVLRSD